MSLYKKIVSVVVSCAFVSATAMSGNVPQTIADDIPEDISAELYDNTESAESKEQSETNIPDTNSRTDYSSYYDYIYTINSKVENNDSDGLTPQRYNIYDIDGDGIQEMLIYFTDGDSSENSKSCWHIISTTSTSPFIIEAGNADTDFRIYNDNLYYMYAYNDYQAAEQITYNDGIFIKHDAEISWNNLEEFYEFGLLVTTYEWGDLSGVDNISGNITTTTEPATNTTESPFNVFDIYNAHMGYTTTTTTTTTKPTTTTTTTTTTKPTTTTTTTTTTKPTTTTTTTTTTKPTTTTTTTAKPTTTSTTKSTTANTTTSTTKSTTAKTTNASTTTKTNNAVASTTKTTIAKPTTTSTTKSTTAKTTNAGTTTKTTNAAASTTKATTAKATTSTNTTTSTTDNTAINTVTTSVTDSLDPAIMQRQARGMDVSAWQPNIDWATVKDSGIEFAIMRAGYGKHLSQEDPTFDYNMQQAQANGIQCGAYWYSYATTVEDAIQEAEVCYEVIKDYDFTYPVYFDIEDPSQDSLSTAQISAMTEAFCSTLAAKGYRVGIYSYTSFLKTKIYSDILDKYDVWVAHFDVSAPSYSGNYGMWQYTASGYVDGVPGVVDLDVSYVNYPYIMSPETYVDTPATTFDSGIRDITSTTTATNYLAKGIDVSVWQGDIDWQAVKDSGEVDYAIIRAGYGRLVSQEDTKFDYNITTAQSLGIDCGAYWYSYATDVEGAIAEAKAFCEVIKGYKFEYPVYFDIEDAVFDKLSMAEVDAITEAFCSYMEEQGYCCGITSYSNFLKNKLGVSFLNKYAVWIAHYNVRRPSYGGYYGMWQHSCTGSVAGINGNVDLDYAYVDYPALMAECHRNGY